MTLKIVKNHKTLSEWFDDLSLKDKLNLYDYYAEQNLELLTDIFYPADDPPAVDVGTIPLNRVVKLNNENRRRIW